MSTDSIHPLVQRRHDQGCAFGHASGIGDPLYVTPNI